MAAFGGTYVLLKKTVPGDNVQLEFWVRSVFLLFFTMAYFMIYPYVLRALNIDLKSDIFRKRDKKDIDEDREKTKSKLKTISA